MTLKPNESCPMETRLVRLETEQELLKNDMSDYGDALRENTKSLQKLTECMVRHDEMLKENSKNSATRNAILTGVAVGIVVMLVDGLVHLI